MSHTLAYHSLRHMRAPVCLRACPRLGSGPGTGGGTRDGVVVMKLHTI